MFGFGSKPTNANNNNNNNNGPPPPNQPPSGYAPQISVQQAAGLASAAYSVHQSLPPEMQAKVNQYATDQATAYAHQKLGMAPPQSQAPGATSTPTGGNFCLSLFGMGSPPAPAPASSAGTANAPSSSGSNGGMMGMASSLFSFGAPHKPEPAEDPSSFTHLWQAAGEPPKPPQPAAKPGFDFSSMFSGGQPPPKPVPPAGGGARY